MSKPTPISGFPEWLPAAADDRAVRARPDPRRPSSCTASRRWRPARSSRWTSCCARARPPRRSTCCAGCRPTRTARSATTQLGLHFDLTVPFARYVLENAGKLQFPFRRYQIQKVWRGERPQEGRYREFLQADIDIVDRDTLPPHYEAEMPLVIGDALRVAADPAGDDPGQQPQALRGLLPGHRADRPGGGAAGGGQARQDRPGEGGRAAGRDRRGERGAGQGVPGAGRDLRRRTPRSPTPSARSGSSDPLLDEGLEELVRVVETAAEHSPGPAAWPTCSIARGLDYYTGTVYETQLRGYERFGSICSGGRYDNLASAGTDRYPGVGISIGVTRLLGLLFGAGRAVGLPVGADLRARRGDQRGAARRPATGSPTALRAARDRRPRCRRARRSSASRSATPSGAASRTSGSPAPTERRTR